MQMTMVGMNNILADLVRMCLVQEDIGMEFEVGNFIVQPDNYLLLKIKQQYLLNAEKKHIMYIYTTNLRYKVDEVYIDHINTDIATHIIKYGEVKKDDRRKFTRVNYLVDSSIDFGLFNEPCRIINISGGGAKIRVGKNINYRHAIFTLPLDSEILKLKTEVVSVIQTDDKYNIHLKFTELTENDISKIIKQVYQVQIQERKIRRC